ncbi:MAG TPA: hypothetical protein V6C76_09510 [Drouetiella sp.]
MIWWLSFATISLLIGVGYTYRRVALLQYARRIRALAEMHQYRRRLGHLTSELLAQVNELDQKTKYSTQPASDRWSRDFGIVCDQLVKIGETLPLIDELLENQKVDQSHDAIMSACKMVEKVSRELSEIRNTAPKLLDDKKSDRNL